MIQIDEPPGKPFCAQCANQLVWLWSPTREVWVCFVACGCERWSLKPHGCQHAQDPRLWRDLPHGDPPSAEYLQVKQKIASTTRSET